MSDDDMMYDDDEYYDEGSEEGGSNAGEPGSEEESEGVEIENQYYNSKGNLFMRGVSNNSEILFLALIEESIPEAIKSYEKVVDLENGEKGEWLVFNTH